nr:uncharacterized protein LOC109174453 [Ipomoea batatas]
MATAWRPVKGVHVRELGGGRFLFTFYHERDVSRVMNEGAWTYDHNLVMLRRLEAGDDPLTVSLDLCSFWIQVHRLPSGFMSEKTATDGLIPTPLEVGRLEEEAGRSEEEANRYQGPEPSRLLPTP